MENLKEVAKTVGWMIFALVCIGATKAALNMFVY